MAVLMASICFFSSVRSAMDALSFFLRIWLYRFASGARRRARGR